MTGHGVRDIWHGTFWFSYSFLKEAVKGGGGGGKYLNGQMPLTVTKIDSRQPLHY